MEGLFAMRARSARGRVREAATACTWSEPEGFVWKEAMMSGGSEGMLPLA